MKTKLKNLRQTYAEIDLRAFGANLETARTLAGTDVIAVVKADAYGHGDRELSAYAAEHHRCTRFGVATIEEAVSLREHLGRTPQIFVLGHVSSMYYKEAAENSITLTVGDHEAAGAYDGFLKENGLTADVTVKINTGMNRLGFRTEQSWQEITSGYGSLRPVHVMSHLSSADTDREYTLFQCQEFEKYLRENRIDCPSSILNSSGLAGYENICSLARPGILLYGYVDGENDVKLEKVMRIFSSIVQVQEVKKGEAVSYGRRFFAEKDMRVGVVPIGYADGYPRCLTNKSHVFVDGVKCPVTGTVCMDMLMVDLTGVDLNGDLSVEILGDNVGADELADLAGTISYEILTGIQHRIPRIYKS